MRLLPGALAAAILLAVAPGAQASHSALDLVSPEAGAQQFAWASDDGQAVIFESSGDLYRSSGGTTTLLTPETATDVEFAAASPDGATIVFQTAESLGPDGFPRWDIYVGGAGVRPQILADDAVFLHASTDLSRVFFSSSERLAPGDADSARDTFVRERASIALVTTGTGPADEEDVAISADGTRAFWSTD